MMADGEYPTDPETYNWRADITTGTNWCGGTGLCLGNGSKIAYKSMRCIKI